jgi:hypothetical protein
MPSISQDELSLRLNKNGWVWCLISNATPGIVRIQLSDDGEEETLWRKCVESTSLEEAVNEAEKLVNSINAYDYGRQMMAGE